MSSVREHRFGGVTLRILREQCIGTGACSKVVPEVLTFDDQQVIDFTENPPAQMDRERLFEACDVCPVEALVLLDEDGTQAVP